MGKTLGIRSFTKGGHLGMALACGISVIGGDSDGSRDPLRDGLLGELVYPADRESIICGILTALNKPKVNPDGLQCFVWPEFVKRVSRTVDTHFSFVDRQNI